MRVYLLRHGVTAWNETGRIVGYEDLELSELGAAQAAGAQQLLDPCALELALVSPLTRTRQTAALALGSRELTVREDRRLIELKLKGWEGRDRRELASDARWRDWLARPAEVATPEGERLADVRDRALAALRDGLSQLTPRGGLALFTHGGVARVLILELLGLPLAAYHKVRCDCASVSAFEVDGTGALVQVLALNLTHPPRSLQARAYERATTAAPVGVRPRDHDRPC